MSVIHHYLHTPGRGLHCHAAVKIFGKLRRAALKGCHSRASLSKGDERTRHPISSNGGKIKFEAFTDADWGSNLDDRRSVSDIMIMIGGTPVIFESKYQHTVALISAEAEYMALSHCTREVLWTRAILKDLGHEQVGATQIWEDNQGAIALASNAGYNARTKHVDICHHFIRENVSTSNIKVDYVGTENQLADMLTKALGTKRLKASSIRTKSIEH